jgi:GNAT superfamily N-acetyltransferase
VKGDIPVYREAYAPDAEVLAAFQIELARESEGMELDLETVRAGVRAVFADPSKGRYYVAAVGRETASGLLVQREWSDWRGGWVWWIHSVFTKPSFRGRGLFPGLYDFVKTMALLDPEVLGLRLYVAKENQLARRAYERLGMESGRYEQYEWFKPWTPGVDPL